MENEPDVVTQPFPRASPALTPQPSPTALSRYHYHISSDSNVPVEMAWGNVTLTLSLQRQLNAPFGPDSVPGLTLEQLLWLLSPESSPHSARWVHNAALPCHG